MGNTVLDTTTYTCDKKLPFCHGKQIDDNVVLIYQSHTFSIAEIWFQLFEPISFHVITTNQKLTLLLITYSIFFQRIPFKRVLIIMSFSPTFPTAPTVWI